MVSKLGPISASFDPSDPYAFRDAPNSCFRTINIFKILNTCQFWRSLGYPRAIIARATIFLNNNNSNNNDNNNSDSNLYFLR